MKKTLAIILLVILSLLTFVGCKKEAPKTEAPAAEQTTPATDAVNPPAPPTTPDTNAVAPPPTPEPPTETK